MNWFELVVWTYLCVGVVVFIIEFYRYDDRRKWLVLPIPLLFVTFLWPWVWIVNVTDLTRRSRRKS